MIALLCYARDNIPYRRRMTNDEQENSAEEQHYIVAAATCNLQPLQMLIDRRSKSKRRTVVASNL